MRSLIVVLACSALSCTSLPVPDAFARELVRQGAPRVDFREEEEILLEQATLDALRSHVDRLGGTLVALVMAPQGFHPYVIMLFVDRGDSLEVTSTSVYWGVIQAKFVGRFDPGLVSAVVQRAQVDFDCRPGPASEPLFGLVVVDWRSESQVVCRLDSFTESAGRFGDLIQPILDDSRVIYEMPE